MKKLSRIIMSIAICSLLSVPVHSMDEDTPRESKTSTASTISRPSFWKTALVGLGMLSSPMPVESANPGFVGAYLGEIFNGQPSILETTSDNITIIALTPTNYNVNYWYNNPYIKYFNPNTPSQMENPRSLSMKIKCTPESKCENLYIKTIRLCGQTFDVDYYASLIFNPWKYDSLYPTGSNTPTFYDPKANYHYFKFALSVWDSLPALNTTQFEEIFSFYMKSAGGGSCPPK